MNDPPGMAGLGIKQNSNVAPGMATQIYLTPCIRHQHEKTPLLVSSAGFFMGHWKVDNDRGHSDSQFARAQKPHPCGQPAAVCAASRLSGIPSHSQYLRLFSLITNPCLNYHCIPWNGFRYVFIWPGHYSSETVRAREIALPAPSTRADSPVPVGGQALPSVFGISGC